MSSEIEIETIPGLPGDLPEGERVLWQGRPAWKAMARRTFKVRWLAAYFAIFAMLRFVRIVSEHEGAAGALQLLGFAALGTACVGGLTLLAWLYSRTTVYTITTKRVVMRLGVALPMTWNLPFRRIGSADLTVREGGDGDISFQLTKPNRIAWLHLWPHTQPWHFTNARPTFRTIAEPARVSALLSDAVAEWSKLESMPVLLSAQEMSAALATSVAPANQGLRALSPELLTEASR